MTLFFHVPFVPVLVDKMLNNFQRRVIAIGEVFVALGLIGQCLINPRQQNVLNEVSCAHGGHNSGTPASGNLKGLV